MNEIHGNFKQRAHALIEGLPRDATWDDLARLAAARRDLEEDDEYGYSGRIAEEILHEYELMKAEIARVLPGGCDDWDCHDND